MESVSVHNAPAAVDNAPATVDNAPATDNAIIGDSVQQSADLLTLTHIGSEANSLRRV